MSFLKWNDELTEYAKNNMRHQTWATFPLTDIMSAIKMKSDGTYDPRVFRRKNDDNDVIQFLRYFHLLDEHDQLTTPNEKNPFYSGEYVAKHLTEEGQNSESGKHAVSHNFLIGARECLEVARELTFPGKSKASLENQFLNRIVFNNKLNSFKLDNVIKYLKEFDIISDNTSYGFYVTYSPAPLTFYSITNRYLLEASYEVGKEVNAKSMIEFTKMMLPTNIEPLNDYRDLGLAKMPFENWGKYKVWLTHEGFSDLLRLGLIAPVDVAEIIRTLIYNSNGDESNYLRDVLNSLKRAFKEEWENFRGEKPVDFELILEKFEIP
ncbi:MAG: hypothetical protein AB2L14_04030 [Candidatus Xenobiia bacterium LiM19]